MTLPDDSRIPARTPGAPIAFRLALPVLGLLFILGAMAVAFFRPDLAGRGLYALGALGLLLFLTIFFTWEKGNLLNFLHLGIYSALIAGCMVVVYLFVQNHPVSWDLTSDRIHSLSPQTEQYLQRLPAPVKIVAFVEGDQRRQAEEFLALYREANPALVQTEVHDLVRDKLVAQQYDRNVYPGDYYVVREGTEEGEKRQKKVSLGEIMRDAESQITNAIIEVMRDRTATVYYLTGHGEKSLTPPQNASPDAPDASLSRIRNVLQERAFPCQELNLLQRGAIPDDTALLVIAGPTRDLFDLERDMLSDYLANGGKLLLLFDPVLERNTRFPNLVSILSDYGIQTPQNAVVADLASAQLNVGPLTPLIQQFGKHRIVEGLPQEAFFFVEARPVEPAPDLPAGLSVTPLLRTGPGAWSVDVDELIANNLRLRQPESGGSAQTLAVAAVKAGPTPEADTRIVVMGDSDVFTNAAVGPMTATLFYQACNWLAEREDLLSIPPKILSETPILLQPSDLLILSFALGLIVLVVLFGGLGFTVLRRKLG